MNKKGNLAVNNTICNPPSGRDDIVVFLLAVLKSQCDAIVVRWLKQVNNNKEGEFLSSLSFILDHLLVSRFAIRFNQTCQSCLLFGNSLLDITLEDAKKAHMGHLFLKLQSMAFTDEYIALVSDYVDMTFMVQRLFSVCILAAQSQVILVEIYTILQVAVQKFEIRSNTSKIKEVKLVLDHFKEILQHNAFLLASSSAPVQRPEIQF